MKTMIISILVAGVLLAAIVGLLLFGFSDFMASPWNHETVELKPWRPYARLIFSGIMVTLLLIFGGALARYAVNARRE
jgi:hypothetical protein